MLLRGTDVICMHFCPGRAPTGDKRGAPPVNERRLGLQRFEGAAEAADLNRSRSHLARQIVVCDGERIAWPSTWA